jgi:hypothetical protein
VTPRKRHVNTNPKYDEQKQERMMELHHIAKNSVNQSTIKCPVCEKDFLKSRGSIFCSNKGRGNCSDRYKNIINPDRQKRFINAIMEKQEAA